MCPRIAAPVGDVNHTTREEYRQRPLQFFGEQTLSAQTVAQRSKAMAMRPHRRNPNFRLHFDSPPVDKGSAPRARTCRPWQAEIIFDCWLSEKHFARSWADSFLMVNYQ